MRSLQIEPGVADLDRLSDAARAFAMSALAPNTLRTYRAQWMAWQTFACDHNLVALPAEPEMVANWLAQRAGAGRAGGRRRLRVGQSISTLRTAAAALRGAHLTAGLKFDMYHPAITLVLRGASRLQLDAPQQAAALRRDELLHILRGLGAGMKDRRDAALLALGYCFALRRSELVGLDLRHLGNGTGVLCLHNDRLEVQLAHGKSGRAQDVFVLPRRNNRVAVTAIEDWLSVANIGRGQAVLRRVRKSGEITDARLSAQSVALIVKSRGEHPTECQNSACGLSGHSLRVGFATSAAEAGADIGSIQRALGHRTTTMAARYSEAAHKVRSSPLHLPGASLD